MALPQLIVQAVMKVLAVVVAATLYTVAGVIFLFAFVLTAVFVAPLSAAFGGVLTSGTDTAVQHGWGAYSEFVRSVYGPLWDWGKD